MEPDYVGEDANAKMGLAEKLLGHQMLDDLEEQQVQQQLDDSAPQIVGEKQPNQYRDVWAAVLFMGSQCAIFYLACVWGIPALNYSDEDQPDISISYTGVIFIFVCSSLVALLISGLALTLLMRMAHQLIQVSLILTVVFNVVSVFYFAISGYWWGVGASLLFLFISGCYAFAVWRRVPFAAANLQTALTAVQSNFGVVMTAFAVTAAVTFLAIMWLLAYLGVYLKNASCTGSECTSHMHPVVVCTFLLMFYWTCAVGKNILHVTTAGVVGTWWFAPDDASTFCSPAVTDSFLRASTYSLGSICLGSLLTACLQVMHHLARTSRRHGRGNDFLLCVLDCILGFLERLVQFFNKYAYIYIGLYGYDYLTAGKRVMSLFVERGWSTIINDQLVSRVLCLVGVVIGMLTGCCGLLLSSSKEGWLDEFGSSASAVAFFLPFMIGTAIACILMSVVASAVDTVVVAFAEAPREFERNHPGLSAQLIAAWRQVYPDEYGH